MDQQKKSWHTQCHILPFSGLSLIIDSMVKMRGDMVHDSDDQKFNLQSMQ